MTAISGHTARAGAHGSSSGSTPVTDVQGATDEAARERELDVGADAVASSRA